MNRTVTRKELEFDMLESRWNREVRERAGEIMREQNCSPEDALSEAGRLVAGLRRLEATNRRLFGDVADMRGKLEQDRAACEMPDAQRRNERQRIIDSLPDCLFCGSRPVWHAHATSYGWVKCSGPDCRNRDAWYKPDQWRARADKIAYTPHKAAITFEIIDQRMKYRQATGESLVTVDLLSPDGGAVLCLPVPEPYLIGQMLELTYRVKETG